MPEQLAFNMDCLEALKDVPDKYFDLCIADPPYGLNITGQHGSQTVNVERERANANHRMRKTIRR